MEADTDAMNGSSRVGRRWYVHVTIVATTALSRCRMVCRPCRPRIERGNRGIIDRLGRPLSWSRIELKRNDGDQLMSPWV